MIAGWFSCPIPTLKIKIQEKMGKYLNQLRHNKNCLNKISHKYYQNCKKVFLRLNGRAILLVHFNRPTKLQRITCLRTGQILKVLEDFKKLKICIHYSVTFHHISLMQVRHRRLKALGINNYIYKKSQYLHANNALIVKRKLQLDQQIYN